MGDEPFQCPTCAPPLYCEDVSLRCFKLKQSLQPVDLQRFRLLFRFCLFFPFKAGETLLFLSLAPDVFQDKLCFSRFSVSFFGLFVFFGIAYALFSCLFFVYGLYFYVVTSAAYQNDTSLGGTVYILYAPASSVFVIICISSFESGMISILSLPNHL